MNKITEASRLEIETSLDIIQQTMAPLTVKDPDIVEAVDEEIKSIRENLALIFTINDK